MNEKHIHFYIHVYNVHCVQLKYQPTNQPTKRTTTTTSTYGLAAAIHNKNNNKSKSSSTNYNNNRNQSKQITNSHALSDTFGKRVSNIGKLSIIVKRGNEQ